MQKKRIFIKKPISNYKIKLLLISLTLIITIFYLFYKYTRYNDFKIPQFKENYYIIPKNKEGLKVPNVDKKACILIS